MPFHQVTVGIGLPPPDSHFKTNSSPSINGPIEELLISDPSSRVNLTNSGLTETEKTYLYYVAC